MTINEYTEEEIQEKIKNFSPQGKNFIYNICMHYSNNLFSQCRKLIPKKYYSFCSEDIMSIFFITLIKYKNRTLKELLDEIERILFCRNCYGFDHNYYIDEDLGSLLLYCDRDLTSAFRLIFLMIMKRYKFNSFIESIILTLSQYNESLFTFSETNKEILFELLHLNEGKQNAYDNIIKIIPKTENENYDYYINLLPNLDTDIMHKFGNGLINVINNCVLTEDIEKTETLIRLLNEKMLEKEYSNKSLIFCKIYAQKHFKISYGINISTRRNHELYIYISVFK